ncbi:MAG: Spy/CpxP family protein refolding chaperone [Acidobacteria bacterium]|nr:Spy/CpxP family protein refolding chaperone [Acidobacteriota bacterium]
MSIKRWMTLIGVGVLTAGLLPAQPATGRRAWRNSQAAPGVQVHRGLVFIAGYLDLTADQRTQTQAIMKDARTQVAALAPELKDQRAAVQEAVQNNADDNTIQNLATKQGDLQARLAAIRFKAMAKFYALLTPQQKTKAAQLRGQLEGLFGGGPGRFGR